MDTPAVGTAAQPVARRLVASLFLILLVASVAGSLPATVWNLVDLGHTDAALTATERAQLWSHGLDISPAQLSFYRRAVRPGDRFYVQTPLRHRIPVAQATSFALLPNLMVATPQEADVVLSFDASPARLGLRYTRVLRNGNVAAARIAHGG